MATPMQTTDETSEDFLPGIKDVTEFTQKTLRAVLQATKFSNDLPAAGDDFDFYSSFQGFRDILDIEGKRILHIVQNVMQHQNVRGKLSHSDTLDLSDKFDVLTDANDQILERVGSWLDEASGIKKKDNTLVIATATPKQGGSSSWNKKTSTPSTRKAASYHLLSAKNIQRPQLRFKDKIDNRNRPFVPHIKEKPNALKTLEESLRLPEDVTAEMTESPLFLYPHPYQYELDHWRPTPQMLSSAEAVKPRPTADTPLTIVTTVSELVELCDRLRDFKVIGVDLEHHSYRTFQGITCLMQISTQDHDYIVDTLELRSDLHMLNIVFTDPSIVKVFHGADSDVDWLQRDLGLYVVNMFDTGQAAKVLNLARFSLAHILKLYCGVEADKQYQLADWRIRPLPQELVEYAREDTHYLMYIYNRMKNELIERGNEQKNLLLSVLQRSTEVCSKVYKKYIFSAENYLDLYHKSKKVFNSQQLEVLRNLYTWRDRTGRLDDESLGYVLPNHMLLQIAEILPRERQGVLACCNPIPPLVRQYLPEMHVIIMEARDKPLVKMTKQKVSKPTSQQHPKYDSDSLLLCPHDLSYQSSRIQDAESVLLPDPLAVTCAAPDSIHPDITLKTEPSLSILGHLKTSEQTRAKMVAAKILASFLSPFLKYLPQTKDTDSNAGPPDTQSTDVAWKLVKNTVKKTLPKEETAVTQAPVGEPPAKRQRQQEDTEEGKEEETPRRTLSQILKAKYSKLKKVDTIGVTKELPEGVEVKKKKKEPKSVADVEDSFQPYDYSKPNSSMFQGGASGKSNVYNPNRYSKGKGNKAPKPKLSTSKSNKSHSFKDKKRSKH